MSSSPIRIGYVLKMFPRLSETFVLNEILELERQGLRIDVFSLKAPTEPRFHARLGRLRAEIQYLGHKGSTSSFWQALQGESAELGLHPNAAGEAFLLALRSGQLDLLLQAMQLVAAINRRGIDHIHSHFATSATWVALLAHMLSGVSFSFTAHAKDIYHREADQCLLGEAMERAAFVVTVTDHNVGHLRRLAQAPSGRAKIRRIYNGVHLDEFRTTPSLLVPSPTILGVGRLVEKKGFRYLIEACRILKDKGVDFRCSLIGGGVEEDRLRSQVAELGLSDTVHFKGAQPHEFVMDQISQARMLVLPCVVGHDGNQDALPTVLLEAMALGRPVVSTDLPGVTEIVDHDVTGLLVPQNDSRALAEAIQRLILEPELGLRLGRQARLKAERLFSLERNVADLAAQFRETVTGRAGFGAAWGRGF